MPRFLPYSLLFAGIFFFFSCSKKGTTPTPPPTTDKVLEIKGADMSYLPEVRSSGLTMYNAAGQAEDMLTTAKNVGVNTIRLRLWKDPATATSSFATVKALAQEVKAKGMKVLLSVHYSDTWADPGHQATPAAWQSLSYALLKDSVYAYTKKIMNEIAPNYIQLGNEINSGLLLPIGSVSDSAKMNGLLRIAATAVREAATGCKIIIHHAGINTSTWFFAQLTNVDYDIIGLSYYPIWHGKDMALLKQEMTDLSNRHSKSIMIAETSYPFSLGWNDWTNNVVGLDSQIIPEFAATPAGQKAFVERIATICKQVPKALGFCYWGAEWISYKGNTASNASTWENQAFWDFNNKALPVLEAYK